LPDDLIHIPEKKRLLLEGLVEQLSQISGIAAIVLGGSYASGTFHETSDLDIGLYYFADRPFSIEDIKRVAQAISVNGAPTITDFYEWGAWVNEGAWIHAQQGKVDFLYRNLDQIQRSISEAHQGIIQHDYYQRPAYGIYSVIYLAETQICIPMYDPDLQIASLKRQVETYPPRLKKKIIQDSLWAVEFTLPHEHSFAAQGDIYNTVGCLTRVLSNLTQALFALNARYFLRDKGVMAVLDTFTTLPPCYTQQVKRILVNTGKVPQELVETIDELVRVWQSVISLPEVQYQPKFRI